MPELPEVETTRRGIAPFLEGHSIARFDIRQRSLRWPIPEALDLLVGQPITSVTRRAKYLLINTPMGSAIVHLGMSGAMRVLPEPVAPGKHDHVDVVTDDGTIIRFTDPRRFGAWLYQAPGEQHKVLSKLGPEPLTPAFNADYLYERARKRQIAVKTLIMDNAVVVGIGNIYANEALFMAGIDPRRSASNISHERYATLVAAIKQVLNKAITQGGTTLRDFLSADGKPGYFAQQLQVYGRYEQPCRRCGTPLREVRQGGRSTVYCPHCQH